MQRSLLTGGRLNAAMAVLMTGLLAGCATAAQRQYQAMTTGNRAIVTEAKVCVEAIYNAPEAAPLRPHTPLNPTDASLTQLSDKSLATKADIDAILLLHPRLKGCQKTILDGLLNTTPSVIPILTREYAAADDDTILLIQRKMSWGERVRRARDRVTATQAAIQNEARSVTAGLERQHEGELARRQAALDAMARWGQTQQMINAMNRPVTTNCTNLGSGIVNCVSQ
jgi:hypothetical protein